jgi:hypothetical protein
VGADAGYVGIRNARFRPLRGLTFFPISPILYLYYILGVIMDIQIVIALLTLAASVGLAWGVITAKLRALEIRLAIVESEHKSDHDLLIEIRTKLDMLLQQLGMRAFSPLGA